MDETDLVLSYVLRIEIKAEHGPGPFAVLSPPTPSRASKLTLN